MTDPDSTFELTRAVVVEELGVKSDEVVATARLQKDLGADSLDVVGLVMEIEDQFGIDIPDEDVEAIVTVGDLVAYIEKKQAAG